MSAVTIECPCPPKDGGTRHPDGDVVTLRETLDFRAAIAVRNEFALLRESEPDTPVADLLAFLTEQYLLRGVEAWTLVDAEGKPLPVSRAAILDVLLADPVRAVTVADAADALYGAKVVLPLLTRASAASQPTPTEPPTSAPTDGSPKPPTRSSRSSTSTSPTDDTEMTSMSLVGASS